jgi:hypothetical protein
MAALPPHLEQPQRFLEPLERRLTPVSVQKRSLWAMALNSAKRLARSPRSPARATASRRPPHTPCRSTHPGGRLLDWGCATVLTATGTASPPGWVHRYRRRFLRTALAPSPTSEQSEPIPLRTSRHVESLLVERPTVIVWGLAQGGVGYACPVGAGAETDLWLHGGPILHQPEALATPPQGCSSHPARPRRYSGFAPPQSEVHSAEPATGRAGPEGLVLSLAVTHRWRDGF